jgi:hypothetical protein
MQSPYSVVTPRENSRCHLEKQVMISIGLEITAEEPGYQQV